MGANTSTQAQLVLDNFFALMTNNIVIYKLCFVFTQVVFVSWQVLISELM